MQWLSSGLIRRTSLKRKGRFCRAAPDQLVGVTGFEPATLRPPVLSPDRNAFEIACIRPTHIGAERDQSRGRNSKASSKAGPWGRYADPA